MVPLLGAQIALFCYVFPLCEGGEEEPERNCRPPLSLFCCSDVSFLSSLLPTSSSVCEYRTSGIGKPADRPTLVPTQIRIRLRYSISRSSRGSEERVETSERAVGLPAHPPACLAAARASSLVILRRTLFLLIATSFLPTWPT